MAVEEVRELLLPARVERRAAVAAAEVDTDEAVDPADDASEPKLCSVDDIDAVAQVRSVLEEQQFGRAFWFGYFSI